MSTQAHDQDVAVRHVSSQGLRQVGRRLGLGAYLLRVWRFRHYVRYDARATMQAENRKNWLGNAWLVLTPVLNGLTYLFVFGFLLQTSRGIENFIGFLTVGVFMFSFTNRTCSSLSRALTQRNNVADAFHLPRAVLPLGILVREAYKYFFVIAAMVVVILAIPPHADLTVLSLLLPLVVLCQVGMVLGVGMILARIVSRIPDFGQLVSFVIRLWMYTSGVFFSFERFADKPTLYAIIQLNPMHQVLDISRDILLYAQAPSPQAWTILGAWTVGLIVVGFLFFWQGDEQYRKDLSR